MHDELNCSLKVYNELLKKVSTKTIFNFLLLSKHNSNVLRLMYYMDEFGSFLGRKRPFDHIAKTIFENLEKSEKKQIFLYIEYITEGE